MNARARAGPLARIRVLCARRRVKAGSRRFVGEGEENPIVPDLISTVRPDIRSPRMAARQNRTRWNEYPSERFRFFYTSSSSRSRLRDNLNVPSFFRRAVAWICFKTSEHNCAPPTRRSGALNFAAATGQLYRYCNGVVSHKKKKGGGGVSTASHSFHALNNSVFIIRECHVSILCMKKERLITVNLLIINIFEHKRFGNIFLFFYKSDWALFIHLFISRISRMPSVLIVRLRNCIFTSWSITFIKEISFFIVCKSSNYRS